jgi:plasmid stability protein
MTNITIRNIPDSISKKLKILSEIERRSLNSELLVALESGVEEIERRLKLQKPPMSSKEQIAAWKELGGKWKDKKSKKAQIDEIYHDRTLGRDISL